MDQRTLSIRLAVITHKIADVNHRVLMDEDIPVGLLEQAESILAEIVRESESLKTEITTARTNRGRIGGPHG